MISTTSPHHIQLDDTKREHCHRCDTPCQLQPISSQFDTEGEKYGALWHCPDCGWYDIDKIIDPASLIKKEAAA